MSTKPQIELFLENESGTQQVAYPFVESDHVSLSNGMDIDTMIRQDVSMPTVAHEDLSFKVGVGDQDVSSAIVDSSVAEMTIKGKTYQNILPEPSTHVLTNNKEMFKVNEGLDPNVEIVDGVSKSAILTGQTLVNLLTYFMPNVDYMDGQYRIRFSNVDNFDKITIVNKNSKTIKFSYFSNGWQEYEIPAFNNVLVEIPKETNEYNIFALDTFGWDSTNYREAIDNIVLLHGDYVNVDIPYFEGMQSVKMPVLTTTGKNLFNISQEDLKIIKNNYFNDNGVATYSPNYFIVDNFISVSQNTDYTFTFNGGDTGWKRVVLYDENYNFIKVSDMTALSANKMKFNSESASYIKLQARSLGSPYNFQLEEGSTATPYEPYKSNILTVNEDVELRGIGDVKDELNVATGEVTERIGEIKTNNIINEITITKRYTDKLIIRLPLTLKTTTYPTNLSCPYLLCDKLKTLSFKHAYADNTEIGVYVHNTNTDYIYMCILNSNLVSNDLDGIKEYLKANPSTIQYKLLESTVKTVDLSIIDQDGNTPEGLHFFKDGHIIQSSGADNSLIPTLDYQAKTSNSYVMDLMKTNTKYTMKAKSVSGTFTIDGTSYGAGTNGAFTTPTSMTNKFLVMSNNANEEIMILEGDVTDKTIPYFKGIKSAFEDEDKIEVLSTGKNVTHIIVGGDLDSQEYNFMNILEQNKNTNAALNCAKVIKWVGDDKFFVKGYGINQYDNQYNIDFNPSALKPNTTYYISFESIEGSHETNPSLKLELDSFNVWLNGTRVLRVYSGGTYSFTTPSQINGFSFNIWLSGTKNKNATIYAIFNKFMITEGKSIDEGYEPHKSNNTKIPLLSPLRSLPNGVCDELIIDRMKKKATLVQRVGVGVLDGTQNINMVDSSVDTSLYQPFFCGDVFGNMAIVSRNEVVVRCDKLLANSESPSYEELTFNAIYQYTDSSACLAGQITKKDLGVKSVKDWFRANPTTIYYQLATPVVTEVDLEGFPYIYKDGHIFLNGEIAPVTEIKYSINQQHQIEANNQDLIRHQKEIDYLYKLIGEYVRVDYKNTLLSLNLELK